MSEHDDIDDLARFAYAEGVSPVDWAIRLAQTQLDVQTNVLAGRLDDPNAYPGYFLPLDNEAVACRIVGELLNAGWQPPRGRP